MKYIVRLRNPKSGEVETYITEADAPEKLESLRLFRDLGYEIIGVEPKRKEG